RLRARGGVGVGNPAALTASAAAAAASSLRPGHVSLQARGGAGAGIGGSNGGGAEDPEVEIGDGGASARKLAQLVEQLRARVVAAEDQLGRVRDENRRLRSERLDAGGDPLNEDDAVLAAAGAASRRRRRGCADADEEEAAARELRDARARLQLVQTRHDHLEAKARAQAELYEGTVERLEESNRQLRDMRRTMQELRHDKDVAEAKAARSDDLEEAVLELRQANRSLEEQVTRLCESPFVATAFAGQERADRLAELEAKERLNRGKMEHLQESAHTHHAALLALQKQAARLREEKEQAERALQELRARYNESEAGQQLLADKMRLYAGDEDVDMEELERALTLVRRRLDNGGGGVGGVGGLPFLENAEGPDADDPSVLRRRLQHTQVQCLSLARELERAERMLKAQLAINRDLHLELEDSARRGTAAAADLRQRLGDFEALALERLTRVHRLEAQVKQLIYGAKGKHGKGGHGGDGARAEEGEAHQDALLAELAEGDFGPDENVVEVWVVAAEVDASLLAAAAATFVVVDFFDYESQATPLLTGPSPRYDFAATYKVTVDDFFLRFLGTESLSLELNQTRAADFELLARARVPLADLLLSTPRVVLPREPLLSVQTDGGVVSAGAVVGYVHVEVRMALPVTELYALFLERNPGEKSRVSHARLHAVEAAGYLPVDTAALSAAEEARLHNDLEVTVVACEGLPPRNGYPDDSTGGGSGGGGGGGRDHPRPYVHYQLLGFPDTFTPVAPAAASMASAAAPVFNHTTTFPVTTDLKLLRFLGKYTLALTVLDDLGADGNGSGNIGGNGGGNGDGNGWNDDSDGLIGEARLPLAALADGDDVDRWTDILDESGRRTGRVRVRCRFRRPLKTARDLGPNALTGPEVEALISRFSPQRDGQVAYVPFLRFADPPPAVLAALDRLYDYVDHISDAAGSGGGGSGRKGAAGGHSGGNGGVGAAELLMAVAAAAGNPGAAALTEEEWVSGMLAAAPAAVPPDELVALFAHAEPADGGTGCASVADLAALARRPTAGARRVADKLRARCREIKYRNGLPSAPFDEVDAERCGRISRLHFKHALRGMGFVLVDEPDAPVGWDPAAGAFEAGRAAGAAGAFGGGSGKGSAAGGAPGPEDGPLLEEAEATTAPLRRQAVDEAARQREAFERHVHEVEALARRRIDDASAAAAVAAGTAWKEKGGAGAPEDSIEPLAAAAESERFPWVQQPNVVSIRDTGARAAPRLQPDAAAARVQSAYRGHAGRRALKERTSAAETSANAASAARAAVHGSAAGENDTFGDGGGGGGGSFTGGSEEALLAAEDAIATCYNRVEGARALPDLRPAFATLDREGSGFVDRPRFALALRRHPDLRLPPAALAAAMAAFDASGAGDGSLIDYRAFVAFAESCIAAPEPSAAVARLRTAAIHAGSEDAFRRRDATGAGALRRVDFFEALRELGLANARTPARQLHLTALLFESEEDRVDYEAFLQFVGEGRGTAAAAALENRLRRHLLAVRDARGLDLRAAFAAFDRRGTGVIEQADFNAALTELGFRCTAEEVVALHKRVDPRGTGIVYSHFIYFL
ncbi:unnamed protein product, partial [Phaeothamnion confervicola]